MKFDKDISLIQQKMSETSIGIARRQNILKELNNAKGILEETIEKRENYKNQFIEEGRDELQVAQRERGCSHQVVVIVVGAGARGLGHLQPVELGRREILQRLEHLAAA